MRSAFDLNDNRGNLVGFSDHQGPRHPSGINPSRDDGRMRPDDWWNRWTRFYERAIRADRAFKSPARESRISESAEFQLPSCANPISRHSNALRNAIVRWMQRSAECESRWRRFLHLSSYIKSAVLSIASRDKILDDISIGGRFVPGVFVPISQADIDILPPPAREESSLIAINVRTGRIADCNRFEFLHGARKSHCAIRASLRSVVDRERGLEELSDSMTPFSSLIRYGREASRSAAGAVEKQATLIVQCLPHIVQSDRREPACLWGKQWTIFAREHNASIVIDPRYLTT